jgi:hypothetical protein
MRTNISISAKITRIRDAVGGEFSGEMIIINKHPAMYVIRIAAASIYAINLLFFLFSTIISHNNCCKQSDGDRYPP